MSASTLPSKETLTAYVDGELPPEEMTRIAALLTQHAGLQAYVTRQQALRSRLDAAFLPVLAQAVPERLQRAAQQTPPSLAVQIVSEVAQWRSSLYPLFSWRTAIPATAALALGLTVGVALERSAPSQRQFLQGASSGQVLAQGALAYALDQQLASDDNRASAARIGVSFRDKSGKACRTFILDGDAASLSGVACHTDGGWIVAALVSAAQRPAAQTPYQMAGAEMPAVIRSTVNALISGAPFDAAGERKARDNHWSSSR